MQVPRTISDLEEILSRKYFRPEARLYLWLFHVCSKKNKKRYVNRLVERLRKKGVVLPPDLIEILYRIPYQGTSYNPKKCNNP